MKAGDRVKRVEKAAMMMAAFDCEGRLKIGLMGLLVGAVLSVGSFAGAQVAESPVSVAAKSVPWEYGVLFQGGVGLEDRTDFSFVLAGVHLGKVLTPEWGTGVLKGNFEYSVEVFPLWQSYTPMIQRQNCAPVVPGSVTYECSAVFSVGGTYTGVSVTPAVLRWNFAGTRRVAPWVQGAGGVIWTDHKYPAFGGPPYCAPGPCSITNPGVTLINNIGSANTSVWNFTPQFGVGMHYFLSAQRSVDFGANAIHISSASLGDKNPGVNASVQFTVGYSWWK